MDSSLLHAGSAVSGGGPACAVAARVAQF